MTTSGPITIGGDATASVLITGSGNIVYAGARDIPRWPQFSHYLRMLSVISSPVANPAGDGIPEGATLDVWGEWERLCNAVSSARDSVADPSCEMIHSTSCCPWAEPALESPGVPNRSPRMASRMAPMT